MQYCAKSYSPSSAYLVWSSTTATENVRLSEILHGLEKFHHYCFARVACIISDQKPLVAILSKDVATLSQQLQYIMLLIHQYRVYTIYKPGSDVYIIDWLPHNNHAENKDKKIAGVSINVSAISTFSKHASVYIHRRHSDINTCGSTPTGAEVYSTGLITPKGRSTDSLRQYWPIRNELAMINGIAIKSKRTIIPFQLKKQILEKLHSKHGNRNNEATSS